LQESKLRIQNINEHLIVCETVTIQCEVVANPTTTSVYWQKLTTGNNAVTIDTSNTAKYGGATIASPSLIIRNLDSSDIAI
jgi:hypothetical protein